MDQTVDFLTEDFSAEVEAKIPEYVDPVKKDKSKLSDALEKLLVLEKKTRLAADQKSTTMLAIAIVTLCKDCGDWKQLGEHIQLLCKRRAQLKRVIQSVVQESMKFLDDTPDQDSKVSLIEVLRVVSSGKMFVELERAQLTRKLCQIKEDAGEVAAAADLLQEVSVETIGSMDAREKLDFILEQMRLCLAKKDYIRTEIISKKVAAKHINKEEMQDLKLKYYRQLIELHSHNEAYLDVCKAYEAIYNTPSVQADEQQWREALAKAVIFVSLSPFDSEVSDLLERFKRDPKVELLPAFKQVLVDLTTHELISWPMSGAAQYEKHAEFQGDLKDKLTKELHRSVIRHNIRVCAKYYKRMTYQRLAELLQLDADTMESSLSDMVSTGQLSAKMDRCVGTVTFQKTPSPALVLNGWATDISQLLTLVDKTCHLINKENMTHGIA